MGSILPQVTFDRLKAMAPPPKVAPGPKPKVKLQANGRLKLRVADMSMFEKACSCEYCFWAIRRGLPQYALNCWCGISFRTFHPRGQYCSDDCRTLKNNLKDGSNRQKRKLDVCSEYVYNLKKLEGCALCPERRPRCLQFHHIDPSQKTSNISAMAAQGDLLLLKEEIAKCVIVCGNCHVVIENGDGFWNEDRPKNTRNLQPAGMHWAEYALLRMSE